MLRHNRWFTPWVLVVPALVWLLVFNLWPSVNTVILSFTNAKPIGGGHFIGLQNFRDLLQDSQLRYALLNSVVYMLVCLPLLTILPLLIAVLVEKKLPGITFFRTAFYTPVVASAVVVALMWTWILDERGLVNGLALQLRFLQEPLPFLSDRWLLLFSAISLTVWKGLGYYMIIYLAALTGVRTELYEAAELDGAGIWSRVWHVTLPQIRGIILIMMLLQLIGTFQVFTEPFLFTGGGPDNATTTILLRIYRYAFINGDFGAAAALSELLAVVLCVLSAAYHLLTRRWTV